MAFKVRMSEFPLIRGMKRDYFPNPGKHTRAEYEDAYKKICQQRGGEWKTKLECQLVQRRLEIQMKINARKQTPEWKQKQLLKKKEQEEADDIFFRKLFLDTIVPGVRVWLRKAKRTKRLYGIVTKVHGYNDISLLLAPTTRQEHFHNPIVHWEKAAEIECQIKSDYLIAVYQL